MNRPHEMFDFFRKMLRAPEGETGAEALPGGEEAAPAVEVEAPTPTLVEGGDVPEDLDPAAHEIKEGEETSEEAEGEAKAEDEAPAPLTAEDIALPEGFEAPEEVMSEFLTTLNDADLSPKDRAQKLIDLQTGLVQESQRAAQEAGEKLWKDMQAEWQAEAKKLPEIGGDKLPGTLATIKKGLDQAGATPELYQALNLTGAGNHPQVIAMLHKLVQPFVEGSPVLGAPTKGSLSATDALYPSMITKE